MKPEDLKLLEELVAKYGISKVKIVGEEIAHHNWAKKEQERRTKTQLETA